MQDNHTIKRIGRSRLIVRQSGVTRVEIRHFHAFFGLGGGAKGFNKGKARVGNLEAHFRCVGGFDNDPAAVKDFERMTGARGTLLDAFDREQYVAYHRRQPPIGWREATPQDLQRAAGGERPHIVFLSAPCKGFSGLLSEAKSLTDKYQALNRLTLRGVWLMLEAWAADPPEMILFENVPRLATRGRALLDRITAMLRSYGYATAETTHDCGELGGLGQSRKRFLLVARHLEKVPPLLYVPSKRPLRSVGDVIGKLPVPTLVDPVNPMHRVPALHWRTWVRLAFVEAGSDWRSLNKLAVQDGHLRDFLIVPSAPGSLSSGGDVVADPRVASTREGSGFMGVRRWEEPCGTVQGESRPSNGAFSIADPRVAQSAKWNQGQHYGVHPWGDACGAVTGQQWPNQGRFSVADPRVIDSDFHAFKVVQWNRSAGTVTGARAPGSSAQAVADPRHLGPPKHSDEFRVAPWGSAGAAVTGAQGSSQCVADPRAMASDFTVADPRSGMASDRSAYLTAGHYGVVPWDQPTGAVSAAACHDNGRWSVADPRAAGTLGAMARALPASDEKVAARILSLDGTWHRPFSTLELAALQSLFDPDDPEEAKAFGLDGSSDSAWRERIGNAVPPDAAQSMASEMGRTLLLAWSGETFTLSNADIWVRPFATALSLAQVAP